MTTSTTLIVIRAFSTYNAGDQITDGPTIASIMASVYASYVVPTNAPLPVTSGGVTTVAAGIDNTWNPAVTSGVVNSGAIVISGGVISGAMLLDTVPINPLRQHIEFNNATDQPVILLLDDGNGGSASPYPLDPGAGAGHQGGNWGSTTFKGRIQIFQPNNQLPNGFIYVHQD